MSNGFGVVIGRSHRTCCLWGLAVQRIITRWSEQLSRSDNAGTLEANFLGFYMLGTCVSDDCQGTFPALVTSDAFTQWQAPAGWTQ